MEGGVKIFVISRDGGKDSKQHNILLRTHVDALRHSGRKTRCGQWPVPVVHPTKLRTKVTPP